MRYFLFGVILFLAACGGGSRTVQYTVHSTPIVCSVTGFDTSSVYFCANTSHMSKVLKAGGGILVEGFTWGDAKPWAWGTSYVITVKETEPPLNVADAGLSRELVSIDGQVDDPVGTRYINEVGLSYGGLYIVRDDIDSSVFKLSFYDGTIHCEEAICGPIADKVGRFDSNSLPANLVFELLEIDGERVIGIVEP